MLAIGWAAPAVVEAAPGSDPDASKLQRAEELRLESQRLRDEAKHEEAILLAEEACAILQQELGPNSHHLAACIVDLAASYTERGRHREARALLERALAIQEKALGPDHPDTADLLKGLATSYAEQGERETAKRFFERAIVIQEKAFGPDHPRVVTSLNELAALYRDQGQLERAEPLLLRALSIHEKVLDPDDPRLATSLSLLARSYLARGEYTKAEPLLEQALAIMVKTLGPKHADLAASLYELACIQLELGSRDAALELLRQALDIEEQSLTRALVSAEDSRRLAHASQLFDSTHSALSLHLQAAPKRRAFAALALTTLLRRKGRVQDLSTKYLAMLRRSIPEAHRHILDELSDARARYSRLSHRDLDDGGFEALRAQLAALEREQDDLWAELAMVSPQVRALAEPTAIDDVQASIPLDAALVELVGYRAIFDRGTSKGTKEQRYAAYIVFPHRFDWVDLGPAAPSTSR